MNMDFASSAAPLSALQPRVGPDAPTPQDSSVQASAPPDTQTGVVVSLSDAARAALRAPPVPDPPAELGELYLDVHLDGVLDPLPTLRTRLPQPLAIVA